MAKDKTKRKTHKGRKGAANGKSLVPSLSSTQYWATGKPKPYYDEEEVAKKQAIINEKTAKLRALKTKKKELISQNNQSSDSNSASQSDSLPKLLDLILQLECELDDLLFERINMVSETIKHHAHMRVDLFFLLCIAVYNKKLHIIKGKTDLQHGKGSNGLAGCHASLFPNIYTKKNISKTNIHTGYLASVVQTTSSMLTFFSSSAPTPPKDKDPEWLKYYVASVVQKKSDEQQKLLEEFGEDSILEGTHLKDVMNLTHALPEIVNQFDCKLEGTYQRSDTVCRALEILNKVSQGEIRPDKALNLFLKAMNSFFEGMANKFSFLDIKMREEIPFPKAFKRVWELQKEGTFFMCNAKNQATDPYYDVFLSLPQFINRKIKEDLTNIIYLMYNNPVYERFNEMQEEIYTSKSSYTS